MKENNNTEETYSINDLALMSGFTARTLRNHLNQGLLEGEKETACGVSALNRLTASSMALLSEKAYASNGTVWFLISCVQAVKLQSAPV